MGNALTRKDMIQIFTNSEAKMTEQAIEGGAFELLGGNITGKYVEVTPFTKIVQEWRLKSWPSGITSTVTITIKQSKEDTRLFIKQTGVPVKEVIRLIQQMLLLNQCPLFLRWILPKRAGT